MSGARIGKRGKMKNRQGQKVHNGTLVKKLTNDELRDKIKSTSSGKDRHKCRMELERRERGTAFLA